MEKAHRLARRAAAAVVGQLLAREAQSNQLVLVRPQVLARQQGQTTVVVNAIQSIGMHADRIHTGTVEGHRHVGVPHQVLQPLPLLVHQHLTRQPLAPLQLLIAEAQRGPTVHQVEAVADELTMELHTQRAGASTACRW